MRNTTSGASESADLQSLSNDVYTCEDKDHDGEADQDLVGLVTTPKLGDKAFRIGHPTPQGSMLVERGFDDVGGSIRHFARLGSSL